MTHAEILPAWAPLLTAFLVLLGAGLTLIGAIGTLRFGTFSSACMHRPSAQAGEPEPSRSRRSSVFLRWVRGLWREILIGVFIAITAPITLILPRGPLSGPDRRDQGHSGTISHAASARKRPAGRGLNRR